MLTDALKFELPSFLNADMPPERRGVRREKKGDLLILNTSRTLPAVLRAEWIQGLTGSPSNVEIRLARRLSESSWEVLPVAEGLALGDHLLFSEELYATILSTSNPPFVTLAFSQKGTKLYDCFYAQGEPIRYEYIQKPWDLDYYQTVFATTPGSVEMPSVGITEYT